MRSGTIRAPGFLIKFIPFEGCAVLIIAGGDSIPDLIDFNLGDVERYVINY